MAVGLCLSARAEVSKEYQLKAAFLYNFTKFIEWPPQHFAHGERPIVIGLVGTNFFDHELEKIVQSRKVNGREITIIQVESAAEARSADLLFFGDVEKQDSREILEAIRGTDILTVGQSEQFSALGGMITFKMEVDKVRFEINQDSAEQAGLKISAQLLKLATAVRKKT